MPEKLTLPLPSHRSSRGEQPDNYGAAAPEQRDEHELLGDIEQTINTWLNDHSAEPFSAAKLTALVEFLGNEQRDALETLSATFGDRELHPRRPAIRLFGEEGKQLPSLSLNGWRPGEQSSIHDHTHTEGAYHLFAGSLNEEVFTVPESIPLETIKDHAGGVPVEETFRPFRQGETMAIPTPYIHRVSNDSNRIALTIHAYYPPLQNLRYYETDGNNLTFVEDALTKRARLRNNQ